MKVKPQARHRAFRDDMIAVLKKHGDNIDSVEMLALAAHFVGQIIALQDQRKMTPTQAMELVARNIEIGNKEVINSTMNTAGQA